MSKHYYQKVLKPNLFLSWCTLNTTDCKLSLYVHCMCKLLLNTPKYNIYTITWGPSTQMSQFLIWLKSLVVCCTVLTISKLLTITVSHTSDIYHTMADSPMLVNHTTLYCLDLCTCCYCCVLALWVWWSSWQQEQVQILSILRLVFRY